jgi:hypothetical protein
VESGTDIAALLAGSSVSMLGTSRVLLRVRGEQSVPLGPLPSSEAV